MWVGIGFEIPPKSFDVITSVEETIIVSQSNIDLVFGSDRRIK